MKKLLGIIVLGLLWCNFAFANYLKLNKCFVVEFTQDGKTTKADSSFDSGNYYKIKEDDMQYVSAYYKLNDKIKQNDDVYYSINFSNSSVNRTTISTDEFNQFFNRLMSKMYPSRNISSQKKVQIENFEIKNYTGDFIITKIKKNMVGDIYLGTVELEIDLNNSIIYIYNKDQPHPEGNYDTTTKVQCDNTNKEAKKKEEQPKDKNEKISGASGTAFFIDNNGHVITNHHVIDGCKDRSQISYNNENIKAKLIAKDEFLDLALLKADIKNTNFITISADPPKKLKRVIVAGYPFGLELSNDLKFNSGIITSLKGLGDDSTQIQIDAAVNPGNSGGPIVYEENGELAAVAVAGLSKDKTEAVNFGIKASSVENFLQSNQIDLTLVKQKFNFTNDDLAELLESSTVYTFCE
jgi:S1-C subfamily serine protease